MTFNDFHNDFSGSKETQELQHWDKGSNTNRFGVNHRYNKSSYVVILSTQCIYKYMHTVRNI